ncbi:integrase arm-type DNA-binding domain-containing protein [Bradyrhizobium sp. 137]|uniref:tyrosine-type recombinase/integrase n=1 Tax=Bradyrhizobium sp. 137 TaxID=2782614 RepID=UPI0021125BED|nr:integrase arm-type DNA-binding domain-containing protein [Bradyrhizobium sp. 137]MCK1755857.1 integrase arm-type DNA-binding domain-containing protein [Bradyrhizobium sp. 137]
MARPRSDGSPAAAPDKRKLSNFVINSLKPRAKPYTVWDTSMRGFALVVHASGRKVWKAIYSRRGRPRWYHIGDASVISLADARQLAGTILLRASKGEDPQAERKAERLSGTFEELAAKYRDYAEHKKKRNKSWEQPDYLVKKHLLPRWAKLQVTDIKRSDVRTMMAAIAAPIVANQTLAAASAIFTWGAKEELIASGFVNPCIGVERNATNERERILADSELPKFWAAFDDAGLVKSSALKMILLTRQRPGEVSHMRVEHLKDGWWEMPGERDVRLDWPGTKNTKSNRVWLSKTAREIISAMDATGFVFTGQRGGAISGLDKAMRDICKQLGVERATPHDLRRTCGSTITGLGFGRDAMDRILNHVEGSTTDIYDRHKYAKEDRKIMEKVASKIMG